MFCIAQPVKPCLSFPAAAQKSNVNSVLEEETERQLKIMKKKIQKEKTAMVKELKKELEQELQEMKKQLVAETNNKGKGENLEHKAEIRMLREEMERQRREFMEREEKMRETYVRELSQGTGQSQASNLGGILNTLSNSNPYELAARGAVGLFNVIREKVDE